MKPEIEVKFVAVSHDNMRAKLSAIGATLEQPMRLMKRAIIENAELKAKNAFIRVRDEGDRTTLTYKQFDSLSVDGAKEYEVEVSDFDSSVQLLATAGLAPRSIQESKRETWTVDGVEIVLDEWPWLQPYIEIEGPSEAQIKAVATRLGFDWSDAVFGDVMAAYRKQYSHLTPKDTVGNLAEVRFDAPLPAMLRPQG